MDSLPGSCHLTCEVEGPWIGTQSCSIAQRGDGRHVLLAQFKIEHVEVTHYPLGGHRFRDDYIADLDMPPNQYLCRRFSVSFGDLGHFGVVQERTLTQRSPCLRGDSQLTVYLAQFFLL